jgi:hypothetical protein
MKNDLLKYELEVILLIEKIEEVTTSDAQLIVETWERQTGNKVSDLFNVHVSIQDAAHKIINYQN